MKKFLFALMFMLVGFAASAQGLPGGTESLEEASQEWNCDYRYEIEVQIIPTWYGLRVVNMGTMYEDCTNALGDTRTTVLYVKFY